MKSCQIVIRFCPVTAGLGSRTSMTPSNIIHLKRIRKLQQHYLNVLQKPIRVQIWFSLWCQFVMMLFPACDSLSCHFLQLPLTFSRVKNISDILQQNYYKCRLGSNNTITKYLDCISIKQKTQKIKFFLFHNPSPSSIFTPLCVMLA